MDQDLGRKLAESVPTDWLEWLDLNLSGILLQLATHGEAERKVGKSYRAFLCWERERAAVLTHWSFSVMLSDLKFAWVDLLHVGVVHEGDVPVSIKFKLL